MVHGPLGLELSLHKRKIECLIPSHDIPHLLNKVVRTIINGCPVPHVVWHAKDPSLLNGHECRASVKICSPLPAMQYGDISTKIKNSRVRQKNGISLNKCRIFWVQIIKITKTNFQISFDPDM